MGLNAANFFVAASGGVTGPFLLAYLLEKKWDYTSIGLVTGLAGMGKLVGNAPVGLLIDRIPQRRLLLTLNALIVGACFGLLVLVPATWYWVGGLLMVSGTARLFLGPLLGALALALVGHGSLNRTLGMNQAFNHLGNIGAALLAMLLVQYTGINGIFFSAAVVCVLAVVSVALIRPGELDEERAGIRSRKTGGLPGWRELGTLLSDRSVLILLVSAALFHLANAPVMPLVAQHVKALSEKGSQRPAEGLLESRRNGLLCPPFLPSRTGRQFFCIYLDLSRHYRER